jgi:hypothetical protein
VTGEKSGWNFLKKTRRSAGFFTSKRMKKAHSKPQKTEKKYG